MSHRTPIGAPHRENLIQTETLDVLAQADQYNRWIFEMVESAVGSRVLEVGCGTGNFSQLLLEKAHSLVALDVVPEYVHMTQERVKPPPGKSLEVRCQNVLEHADDLGVFDTIIMLNVLEHIEDDQHALRVLRPLLKPDGYLILLVPALDFLYSDYDRSIHHFRRYHKQQLQQQLENQHFRIDWIRYFNLVGALGWWFNFCLLKKSAMNSHSVQWFNRLAPLLKQIENHIPVPFGISLIAVAQPAHDALDYPAPLTAS